MDMNKTFFLRTEDQSPRWRLIDASNQIVGRLATKIADALRGKDRAQFTPHSDAGDYIVVINADKIVFTGNKMAQKIYERYSGYIGNKKFLTAEQILEKNPERIIELAVKGMLPKNRLSRQLMRKLLIYAGGEHPHAAQIAGFAEKSPSK
jgi:large subunit ribosomal protein L13